MLTNLQKKLSSYNATNASEKFKDAILYEDSIKNHNKTNTYVYYPDHDTYVPNQNLRRLERFDKKLYDKIQDNACVVAAEYIPYQPRFPSPEEFNLYSLPAWRKTSQDVFTLPACYERFFKHVVGYDLSDKDSVDSYNYMLQWIANSLQRKNLTYLVAIGAQGVGKTALKDLLRQLHGEANSTNLEGKRIANNFNATMANKTFIGLEEINASNPDAVAFLKNLVNNSLTVEAKGQDAVEYTNYANVYITSNDLQSIRVENGDRRFSVVQINKQSMIAAFGQSGADELYKQIMDPANIAELGWYLLGVNVNQNLLSVPLETSTKEDIRQASRTLWQCWLLDEAPGVFSLYGDVSAKYVLDTMQKLGTLENKLPGMRRIWDYCKENGVEAKSKRNGKSTEYSLNFSSLI